jgi:hypothetical protein
MSHLVDRNGGKRNVCNEFNSGIYMLQYAWTVFTSMYLVHVFLWLFICMYVHIHPSRLIRGMRHCPWFRSPSGLYFS